jgi:regulator of nucleoside diphosphate kinase
MHSTDTIEKLPQIVLSTTEHNQLNTLAMAAIERSPDQSDALLNELERAIVVADTEVPSGVARMGSTVTYETANGQKTTVTLVFPIDADIAAGRISIMTPIGIALIGLSAGQSISWRSRDNRTQVLTIVEVQPPKGHAA